MHVFNIKFLQIKYVEYLPEKNVFIFSNSFVTEDKKTFIKSRKISSVLSHRLSLEIKEFSLNELYFLLPAWIL